MSFVKEQEQMKKDINHLKLVTIILAVLLIASVILNITSKTAQYKINDDIFKLINKNVQLESNMVDTLILQKNILKDITDKINMLELSTFEKNMKVYNPTFYNNTK